MKISIIGGDKRLIIAKKELERKGYSIGTTGLFGDDKDNILNSQVILLPVPTTKDKVTVFSPYSKNQILLAEIAEHATDDQLILCCNYRFENKRCIDYGCLDSYSLLNAVPTAEGAIKLAIEKTPFTLWKSNVLIIGYGRVGKVLTNRLKALGCNVTVSARKPADFAMLDTLGIRHIYTSDINKSIIDYDIIFNTVDVKVIENNALESCTAALIVDLSSKGGFDLPAALDFGLCAVKAPGLPGLVAPDTAGKILADTVTDLIKLYI